MNDSLADDGVVDEKFKTQTSAFNVSHKTRQSLRFKRFHSGAQSNQLISVSRNRLCFDHNVLKLGTQLGIEGLDKN